VSEVSVAFWSEVQQQQAASAAEVQQLLCLLWAPVGQQWWGSCLQ